MVDYVPKFQTKLEGDITQKGVFLHHILNGIDGQLDAKSKKKQELETGAMVLTWVTWGAKSAELF